MILKITPSDLDYQKSSEIKKNPENDKRLEGFDFSKAIVNKPWGREYLTYKGESSDIWVLHLKKEQKTSMHCHPNKKTNLIVLKGNVLCKTLNEEHNLKEGDILILEKKVFHSTKALSEGGAIVMEIESPPNKTDLLRLNDNYGREKKGYELQKEMCFDLSEHERVFLKKDLDQKRKIGETIISLKKFKEENQIKKYLNQNKNRINILIEGKIDFVNDYVGETIEERQVSKTDYAVILTLQKNIFDFD